jgi:uncharacterized membrane protein YuzA (DUF378 family)
MAPKLGYEIRDPRPHTALGLWEVGGPIIFGLFQWDGRLFGSSMSIIIINYIVEGCAAIFKILGLGNWHTWYDRFVRMTYRTLVQLPGKISTKGQR